MSGPTRRLEVVVGAYWAVRLDRHQPNGASWAGYASGEVSCQWAGELSAAMGVPGEVTRARFQQGARAWAATSPQGEVTAWLWVSTGRHSDEPIRRELSFAVDEAYGWSAGTVPAHRCRGLFTGLLEQAGAAMRREGRALMWVGIHDNNLASRRAAVRAGFSPVLRLSALVLGSRGLLRTRAADYADPELVGRARRLLCNPEPASGQAWTMPAPAIDTRQPAGLVVQATAPASKRRNPQ